MWTYYQSKTWTNVKGKKFSRIYVILIYIKPGKRMDTYIHINYTHVYYLCHICMLIYHKDMLLLFQVLCSDFACQSS